MRLRKNWPNWSLIKSIALAMSPVLTSLVHLLPFNNWARGSLVWQQVPSGEIKYRFVAEDKLAANDNDIARCGSDDDLLAHYWDHSAPNKNESGKYWKRFWLLLLAIFTFIATCLNRNYCTLHSNSLARWSSRIAAQVFWVLRFPTWPS